MGRRIRRALVWAPVTVLISVLATRVAGPINGPVFVAVEGVGVWLMLAAAPILLLALLQRRPVLATVAGLLVVAQLFWAGSLLGHGRGEGLGPGAGEVVIATANIQFDNGQLPELASALANRDADIVLLQEVTSEGEAALAGTSLWSKYAYRIVTPHPGYHGSAILSRFPLSHGVEFDVAGSPMVSAIASTPNGPLTVVDVHTVAPLTPAEAQQWNAQFDALIHLAGEGTGPLIFAGDFNATLDHAPLRRLIGAGMRDAFAEAGHGSAASWPQYLPIMALDHVLVSDDIGVMSIANENDPGSDHRGQVAALSIRNQP